jgi:hypothetical protein
MSIILDFGYPICKSVSHIICVKNLKKDLEIKKDSFASVDGLGTPQLASESY